MANPIQLPKETVDKIIFDYTVNKYGLIKTGKNSCVGERIVRRVLLENGIHIRSFSEAAKVSNTQRRQFDVDDNYFSNENHNMAYILGFLAADGTVDKQNNRIKIGLSSVDKEFLETLAKEMKVEKKILDYETSNGFKVSELSFTSAKIKQDLAKYNIVPNKTFTFTFPKNLNKEYWIDFIRGYFDGDGSVSSAGPDAIRWQVCAANRDILNVIRDYFKELDIPAAGIQVRENGNNPLYYIQYSTYSTKKIFDILYSENCLKLPRKYEKFKELVMK